MARIRRFEFNHLNEQAGIKLLEMLVLRNFIRFSFEKSEMYFSPDFVQ